MAVIDQQTPANIGSKKARLSGVGTVPAMIMSAHGVALCCRCLGKALIARRMLAESVKYLYDRGRFTGRCPQVNRNSVTARGA